LLNRLQWVTRFEPGEVSAMIFADIITGMLGNAAWEGVKSTWGRPDKLEQAYSGAFQAAQSKFHEKFGDQYGARYDAFFDFDKVDRLLFRACLFADDLNMDALVRLAREVKPATPPEVVIGFVDLLRTELDRIPHFSWLFKNKEQFEQVSRIGGNVEEIKEAVGKLSNTPDQITEALETVQQIRNKVTPPTQRKPFLLPQADIASFTGRSGELERLEEILIKRKSAKLCTIVGLTGTGGMGKSALACHFAQVYRESFIDGVIGRRVDGKDMDTVAREFARACGEELDPDDERDASTLMQEVFSDRRALLIFDNADDVAIRKLQPGGTRCAVIVTTRDRQLPVALGVTSESQIDISVLPDPDSILLLRTLIGDERVTKDSEAARRIVELVGGLPLALQIAGAVLFVQPLQSLKEYETSVAGERERLAKLCVGDDPLLSLRASFSISLRLLKDPEEVNLFACLAVCAREGFSSEAAAAATGWSAQEAEKGLARLYRLSLLNVAETGARRFVFHPLIRLFAQDIAEQRNLIDHARERHAGFFIGLVQSASLRDPAVVANMLTQLDDVMLAAKWLQRQEKLDDGFVTALQPFLLSYGRWHEALDLTSGFLSAAELTEDYHSVVWYRIQQAKFLSLSGHLLEAEKSLAPIPQVLGRLTEGGDRHRYEAKWLNTLGGVLQRQGRFEEAVEAFKRSAEIEETSGNQPGQAVVLNSLGGVLQRQGKFQDAFEAFKRSAAIEETGGNQLGQAMVLNSLGGVLQRQGKFKEAVEAFQRSFALLVQLGDQRGQAMVLNSLGGVLQRQGKFEEAVEAFKRSLAISENLEDERSLAMVLNGLGGVLQRQGKFEEAVEALQRSARIGEGLQDNRHLGMVLNSLGGVLRRQGKFEEAVDAFERSIAICAHLEDERSLAMVLNSLGGVLRRQGKFEEAVDAFERSIAICEHLEDERGLAMVLNSLGGVLQRQGKFKEAVEAFQRSFALPVQLGDQRGQAMVLNSLGGVLQRQGKFKEAVEAFQRSFALLVQLEDQRGQAMVLSSLGGVLQRQGKFKEPVEAFQRSFALFVELGDQRGQAKVLNSLGGALRRQGQYVQAFGAFQESIAIGEKLRDHRHLAMVRRAFGDALLSHGDTARAISELSKAFALDEALKNPKGVGLVASILIDALRRLGRDEEALGYWHRAVVIAPDNRRLQQLGNQIPGT